MAKVNGGWLTAKTLYDFGIRNIFSLGGGHINPIYDACVDLGIRIIDTHHEQGAAMAADAYGRSKRRPAVCLVTAGPGLTNALTGIAGSYLSNSPLIIISGRSGIEENDRNPLQEIDQQAIVTPITKWARTIYDQKRIPEYIGKAYKTAITGKPGPVYLGMSYEVLYPRLDDKEIDKINFEIPKYTNEPSQETISEVLNHLKKSRKPIAIVGSGGWYSDCEKELKRFIESANIPTFTLNLGRGIISDEHKNCFGAASPSAPNGFRDISSNADLILLLGIRLSLYMGFGRSFNKDANIVQVEIDPNEVGSNISPDLAIICDLKKFLIKLNRYLNKNTKLTKYISWNKTAHQLSSKEWKKIESVRSSNKKPIHAVRVAKCVEEVLGNDGIVVIDGGDCQAWTDVTYRVKKPGGYMKGGLLGCMGVGVPFAIGTKLANPKKRVALISGDGAIGMNFMEFETAIRHKIPFVAVVCNDQSWGMTKHQIEITYGKKRPTLGVDLEFTPFHELVKVMGGYGEYIDNPKDLNGAIERGFSSGLPSLINVKTDPNATSPATHAITNMMMAKGY